MTDHEFRRGDPVVRTGPDFGNEGTRAGGVVRGEVYVVDSYVPDRNALHLEGHVRSYIASNFEPASEDDDENDHEFYIGEPVVRTGPTISEFHSMTEPSERRLDGRRVDPRAVVQGNVYTVRQNLDHYIRLEEVPGTYAPEFFKPVSEISSRRWATALRDQGTIIGTAGAILSDVYETAADADPLSLGTPVTVLDGGIVLGYTGSQRPEHFVGKPLEIHQLQNPGFVSDDNYIAVVNRAEGRWATALRSHVVPIPRQEPDEPDTKATTLDLRATFETDPSEDEPCLDGVADFVRQLVVDRLFEIADQGDADGNLVVSGNWETTSDHLQLIARTLDVTIMRRVREEERA